MNERFVVRRNAPAHLFRPGATYMLTAKTLYGLQILKSPQRRQETIRALQFASRRCAWEMPAWVVLQNHYHCLLLAPPEDASALPGLIRSVHRYTSSRWNFEDGTRGRQVWYQYWDTCIDHERSFWARVNYIHHNPVKHGLVEHAHDYPFSSYSHWHDDLGIDMDRLADSFPWDRLDLEY
jgi:putative transposase